METDIDAISVATQT